MKKTTWIGSHDLKDQKRLQCRCFCFAKLHKTFAAKALTLFAVTSSILDKFINSKLEKYGRVKVI